MVRDPPVSSPRFLLILLRSSTLLLFAEGVHTGLVREEGYYRERDGLDELEGPAAVEAQHALFLVDGPDRAPELTVSEEDARLA